MLFIVFVFCFNDFNEKPFFKRFQRETYFKRLKSFKSHEFCGVCIIQILKSRIYKDVATSTSNYAYIMYTSHLCSAKRTRNLINSFRTLIYILSRYIDRYIAHIMHFSVNTLQCIINFVSF